MHMLEQWKFIINLKHEKISENHHSRFTLFVHSKIQVRSKIKIHKNFSTEHKTDIRKDDGTVEQYFSGTLKKRYKHVHKRPK